LRAFFTNFPTFAINKKNPDKRRNHAENRDLQKVTVISIVSREGKARINSLKKVTPEEWLKFVGKH
jgi:hypothetical protein